MPVRDDLCQYHFYFITDRADATCFGECILLYRATNPKAEEESLWAAYDATARLFHIVATKIADRLGFVYPREMEKDMIALMEKLRASASRRD